MRVIFKTDINPFLISLYLNSDEGKKKLAECKKNTTNIAAIYAKDINEVTIPMMMKSEQDMIVHMCDKLLAKEQQAKAAAESAIAQIDTMKKAILARAFRGELGTNDPVEEWAGELVKASL